MILVIKIDFNGSFDGMQWRELIISIGYCFFTIIMKQRELSNGTDGIRKNTCQLCLKYSTNHNNFYIIIMINELIVAYTTAQ